MAYFTLFFSALLAATLIPAQSEALLVSLIIEGAYLIWLLLVAATLGNTLGSLLNWWLGRSIEKFRARRWFPFSAQTLERAQQRFQKYGYWSLLLSWMPLVGDPLTLVAGIMRVPFWLFLSLVLLAKGGRYLLLAWITLSV